MTFAPGDTVGPYRIIEPLGQGGMATVFKAYHAALDRYVAIKVLHAAFKEDPNFLGRFNREARIVAKLDHPNIVPIYDFAQADGTPYLVMRYVEGKTLKATLREGQLPIDRVLSIARPVIDGLAYAHAQGVLHRDIKPSNIIIANDGHIFLTDFGLARIAQAGESTLSQDMLIGTPQYISPEQAKGDPADERTDIYSLGVVLFEMFTGRVPFSADTPYAVIHDHIYTPLPLPRSINPNLPESIERVLLKALEKNPTARYATANELLTALDQAQPAALAAAPPSILTARQATPPPLKPAPAVATKPVSRVRRNVLIGALILIALVACALVAFSQHEAIQRALKPNVPPASQTNEALKAARDKVNTNPNDPYAHIQFGDALASSKEYTKAYAEYDRAIALNPKLAAGYLRAGTLAEQLSDLDRALSYYQNGSQALPENTDLLLSRSDVLMKQKKYDDAHAVIEKTLQIDPGSAQAIWRLGDYDRSQGKLAEALREYGRALVIDPNLPEAHLGMGILAAQRGNTDEAKRQFQMVINNSDAPADLKDQATKQLRALGGK